VSIESSGTVRVASGGWVRNGALLAHPARRAATAMQAAAGRKDWYSM
jgi:hypothetical protein